MSAMEELLPSIGTSVPSPSVLAVVICQSDSILQNVGKLCSDVPHSPDAHSEAAIDTPFDFCDESRHVSSTNLISISDDGKVWNWLVTSECAEDTQKDDAGVSTSKVPASDSNTDHTGSSTSGGRPPSDLSKLDLSFKVSFCLLTLFLRTTQFLTKILFFSFVLPLELHGCVKFKCKM